MKIPKNIPIKDVAIGMSLVIGDAAKFRMNEQFDSVRDVLIQHSHETLWDRAVELAQEYNCVIIAELTMLSVLPMFAPCVVIAEVGEGYIIGLVSPEGITSPVGCVKPHELGYDPEVYAVLSKNLNQTHAH